MGHNDAIFVAAPAALICAPVAGLIVFFATVSLIGRSEEQIPANPIEAPANPTEAPEMGTCIYCGKEIDEETAICDDCLKG